MKHHLPSLDSLKAFESAARHLSFSHAAYELCITKGAVSYQIRKLEEQLQCELFKRSVRQVYLTSEGQTLFNSTKKLFREFTITCERLKEIKQQSNVTIASTTYVAARWLSSRISLFTDKYPNINIVLQHSVNTDEFKIDDADLSILWGPCTGTLNDLCFAEIPMSIYPVISPHILKSQRIEASTSFNPIETFLEEPFCKIPLLCEDRQLDTWQEWFDRNTLHTLPQNKHINLTNPRRVISDANVRVQAAIDGQGLILADNLMCNEMNNGLLLKPFKEELEGYGYGLYSASSRRYADNALILKEWFVESGL